MGLKDLVLADIPVGKDAVSGFSIYPILKRRRQWKGRSNRLVDAIGRDIAIDDIDREHIIVLRDVLQKRVAEGTIAVFNANKDLQHLRRMIRNHHENLNRLDIKDPTDGIRCSGVVRAIKARKPPIPMVYLEKWIDLENWGATNDEVRDIMLVCLETGARQNEIYNAPASAIFLHNLIPHIEIQEEESTEGGDVRGRRIKTEASERRVPLVGVALEAMKCHPNGFPRYRGNRNFSNTATKALRAFSLIPTESVGFRKLTKDVRKSIFVTVGGVRHSSEDRAEAVAVAMDTRGALMGHDVGTIRGRQFYGRKVPPMFTYDSKVV